MGRIFNTQSTGQSGQGRIGKQNIKVNLSPTPVKSWEDLSFWEKTKTVAGEVPKTLLGFVPEATRQFPEKQKGKGIIEGEKELFKSAIVGAGQFAQGIAQVTGQAIGGALLGVKQKITKKPESVNVPILGEISSYQKQSSDLQSQGFGKDEANALVGINAYLGLMPFVAKGIKSKAGQTAVEKITTKEVPVSETIAGKKELLKKETQPVQEKIIEPAIEPTATIERPTITKIKETIGQGKEQKQFNEILKTHNEKFFEGREQILGMEDSLNKSLVKLNDAELKNYSAVTQGLASTTKKVRTEFKTAVDLWKKTNAEIEADLIRRGKLDVTQVENRRWQPIEMTTGRTRAELQQMGIKPIYYPYLAENLLKKSDFIPSLGKRTKGGYLKRFTGKLLQEDSYIKDPKIAIPRNRLQVFRDKMNDELVNDVKKNFAEQDPQLIKIFTEKPEIAERLGYTEYKPSGKMRFYPTETSTGGKVLAVSKKVETAWIPKTVASELDSIFKPGKLEKALRMTYDPLLDLWRISVLNLTPRWIFNNFMGNTMMSFLGKTKPSAFLKSAKAMLKKEEFPKGVQSKEYAGGATGETPTAGKLGGLPSETTQLMRPLENWMKVPVLRSIVKGAIAMGKPGGRLNTVIENWFRTAMYISSKEAGKTPLEAVKTVNEFLFDYSNLSKIERQTFRRALPFWNWQKNITNFAFKFPYNHPVRGLVVGAMLQDYVDTINENQKGDAKKSILRIKIPGVKYEDRPLYLNIKSVIPFSDVFKTVPKNFQDLGRFMTSNPVSKIILERAFRINSFTGQPFTAPPLMKYQELDEYGKKIQPLPSLARHIGTQLPQVGLAEDLLSPYKKYETGEPKVWRGKLQEMDILMRTFKYFGISLTPIDFKGIERTQTREQIKEEKASRIYERTIEKLK